MFRIAKSVREGPPLAGHRQDTYSRSCARWCAPRHLFITLACALIVACTTHGGSSSTGGVAGGSAAEGMRQATAICLRNFRNLDAALAELRARGWSTKPWIDNVSYEFTRGSLHGIISAPDSCTVQTSEIDLDETRAIGASLVSEIFPDKHQAGPEGTARPCDGYTIFPGQGRIVMSYSAAGNSGDCIENSGGAIFLSIRER